MARTFVDTSAVIALMLRSDLAHQRASRAFSALGSRNDTLVTTSYVLVETYALLGRRVGLDAVDAFRRGLAPLFEVAWVDEPLHEQALDLLLRRERRDVSLVDAVSFLAIRSGRIDYVFAYDRHFEEEGFPLIDAR